MNVMSLLAGWAMLAQLPGPGAVSQSPAAPAVERATVDTPDGVLQLNLPPGTKSVMKRSAADGPDAVRIGYDAPLAQVPAGRFADPNVRPAVGTAADSAFTAPAGAPAAVPSTPTAAPSKPSDTLDPEAQALAIAAADFLSQALTQPKDSALAGRGLTISEALSRATGDRNRQIYIARAYWKLSAAQADYDWSIDELAQLSQVAAAKGLESSILDTAQAAAQARMHEAQQQAVATQQELADLLAIPTGTPLPLAADPPLVGAYRTEFDKLFAARVPPPRMRTIDRGLPIRCESIQDRVTAVRAAAEAVELAKDARGRGQADLPTLLNCHEVLASQRRAFLTAVRDYNLDIADYALTVADPNTSNDRLVGMLIRVKSPSVVPASGQTETTPSRSLPSDATLLQPAVPAPPAAGPVASPTAAPISPPAAPASPFAAPSVPPVSPAAPSVAPVAPSAAPTAPPTAPASRFSLPGTPATDQPAKTGAEPKGGSLRTPQ